MRASPVDRMTTYGTRLREQLTAFPFDSPVEQAKVSAILEAEIGLAWTSASLKREILDNGMPFIKASQPDQDWYNHTIRLAPFVCAAIIPVSYMELKNIFCSSSGCGLWRDLSKTPFPATQRKKNSGK